MTTKRELDQIKRVTLNPGSIRTMKNPCYEAQKIAVTARPELIAFINDPREELQEIVMNKDPGLLIYIDKLSPKMRVKALLEKESTADYMDI